jgi:hypothetical protein
MHAEFDVHDMVRELTEPFHSETRYTTDDEVWTLRHVVPVASLVDQLLALGSDMRGSGSQSGSVPHSRPALPIAPHDLVREMHRDSAEWIRGYFREKAPSDRWDGTQTVRGSGTKARLRSLHGLMPQAENCGRIRARFDKDREAWCCAWHHIEHDLAGWWHRSRVLLGWDPGALRPHNTCPACERKGGLVLNPETEHGTCTRCPATFAGEDWDLLVLRIRLENDLIREDDDR